LKSFPLFARQSFSPGLPALRRQSLGPQAARSQRFSPRYFNDVLLIPCALPPLLLAQTLAPFAPA